MHNRNFSIYIRGQAISLVGTWMQTVAQSWLVLELTGSPTKVGLTVAVQTLPMLLLGPYGGVIADRIDKRKLMMGLQTMMGLLAITLGILCLTHVVQFWEVLVLAALLGFNSAFETPARQSFVLDMVGPTDLRNAVTLTTVLNNTARAVGPAVAGVMIAAGGLGVCFLLNGLSFAAVVLSLAKLDTAHLHTSKPVQRSRGQLREGLRYVRSTPELSTTLFIMAVIGCLAWEFPVVLPVVAKQTFHGGARDYGYLTGAMGLGAIVGGLLMAARGRVGVNAVIRTAAAFGFVFVLCAVAPNLLLELGALALLGALGVTMISTGNTTLQLAASPAMRGRVIALFFVAMQGTTPLGGPVAGWVTQRFGGRAGLLLGAAACLGGALYGVVRQWSTRRHGPTRIDLPSSSGPIKI